MADRLTFGPFELDIAGEQLEKHGVRVKLSHDSFRARGARQSFRIAGQGLRTAKPATLVIKVVPELDAVRSDPRFQALLRRMNLAD